MEKQTILKGSEFNEAKIREQEKETTIYSNLTQR